MQPEFLATYENVVCQVLARLRQESGVTQTAFADMIGVSAATWSRIESGESGVSLDHLKRIAMALGLTPARILELADQLIEATAQLRVVASKKEMQSTMSLGGIAAGMASIPVSGLVLGGLLGVAIAQAGKLLENNKQ